MRVAVKAVVPVLALGVAAGAALGVTSAVSGPHSACSCVEQPGTMYRDGPLSAGASTLYRNGPLASGQNPGIMYRNGPLADGPDTMYRDGPLADGPDTMYRN
jgi:hypothetical protein